MSSRRFSIVTGLLVLILVTGASRVVMAADKGFFKGIERFYGDTDGKRLFMEGANLEYFQGETHLRFKAAEIREKADGAREIIFRQEVFLTYEDLKVTGDQFCFDTAEESGTFSGHVVLEREESRDEQGEVVKEGIRLVCGNLYLQTKEKAFIATEAPQIEHADFSGNGETIRYRDEEEKLTISGGFHLLMDGDELLGEEICFDLKQKTFEAQRGALPLEVRIELKEKEETPQEEPGTEGQ
ncbi:MAG TPA: hypothetical protein GXZ97_04870 [Hydrogenispora sp.]|nr:hypothetical protein [Hydrogenispora sp.]